MEIDHKDGDGLNNQRNNIRVVTPSQNMQNARKRCSNGGRPTHSSYKGVTWQGGRHNSWKCMVGHIFIGYFDSETEAAQAYNKAALVHFGKFARLNVL